MNLKAILGGVLLGLLAHADGALANDQFNDRDAVIVAPQSAYVFFRARDRFGMRFLREVTPSERAAYDVEREVRFLRARTRYEHTLRDWEREARPCRGASGNRRACLALPPRPTEVTRETFAFAPPEMDNFVDVGRGPQFTRAEGSYTYLRAIPPGSYTVYGQISDNGNGVLIGSCLCMGSVRFEARPGEIVDLGEIRYPVAEALRASRTIERGQGRLPSVQVVSADASMPIPVRLAGLPVVRATLRAADKMPNYFGVQIDRHPAMPGVLGYRRDVVLDLSGGGEGRPISGE